MVTVYKDIGGKLIKVGHNEYSGMSETTVYDPILVDGHIQVTWDCEYRPCKRCQKVIGIGLDASGKKMFFDFDDLRSDHSRTCPKLK